MLIITICSVVEDILLFFTTHMHSDTHKTTNTEVTTDSITASDKRALKTKKFSSSKKFKIVKMLFHRPQTRCIKEQITDHVCCMSEFNFDTVWKQMSLHLTIHYIKRLMGESRYSSTHSWSSHKMVVGCQTHVPWEQLPVSNDWAIWQVVCCGKQQSPPL